MIDGPPVDLEPGELETPRLVLEPLSVDHANEMVAVLGDPSLYVFTGGEPPSLETLEKRYRSQVSGSGDPNEVWLNWIVRRKDTSAPAGFVQATVLLDDGPSAVLAWVIGSDQQGHGFGAESTRVTAEWLLAHGVAALRAHIHPDHAASHAVARAVGLVETTAVDDDGEVVWASPPGTSDVVPRAPAGTAVVVGEVDPSDRDVAARIVEIQRVAYAIEADLIGFDGIPPLHETADQVCRLDGLEWLGSYDGNTLVGIIGWQESSDLFDIDRLAIHPDWSRQGRGRALVEAVLGRARSTPVTVSTGARNHPACLLYRRLGFRPVDRIQIAPGVFIYRFERAAAVEAS